jgi:hypothetical protein
MVRIAVGAILVIVSTPMILRSSGEFLLLTLGVFIALAVFYALVHYLVSNFFRQMNRWLGAAIANLPIIVVFILGVPSGLIFGSGEGQLAAISYVGIALLIAGIRADPGCEVMSIPGLLFGQRTHLACIAFSPIDWLEEKLTDGK